MRCSALIAATLFCFALPVNAEEAALRMIPQAAVVGKGSFSFAFWDIYDATLYAAQGQLRPDTPFVLSLKYKREISGKDIAERSAQEMRGQGFTDDGKLARWHRQMQKIFPDVKSGMVLSALFVPGGPTRFYEGNRLIGVVEDAEFTHHFAAIWLDEKTSEPELRKKLLGLS